MKILSEISIDFFEKLSIDDKLNYMYAGILGNTKIKDDVNKIKTKVKDELDTKGNKGEAFESRLDIEDIVNTRVAIANLYWNKVRAVGRSPMSDTSNYPNYFIYK